ncbi:MULTISPECIES: class I SAM-dependent methyltransferase [Shewanella]|uniref:Class I SAM-dependent methyltransferase n=1 Tax=Shewanella psychromarinicola TaxID=2487742 RepID=A0A3N4E8V4_9GAMM|nr:class I SAM-dependent methyltransferase [Shewanella psychromarinicola]AZG35676.1 class I SAM-dependent methyltransferase [Shewanella psychromarinicola]MCL1081524.1 class I SAM-dependent methyltransferase [Shewanella psychromarinicola]RPA30401.1 class I SAM-dependent methyltransferase [Shewanella psychromarinicola]
MNNHWSEYWQQGHTTSFGEAISGNYEGILKSVWQPIFNGLNEDFLVVDVGTGNGSLPLLLRDGLLTSELTGKVIGVDLAEVSLVNSENQNGHKIDIALMSNTRCEQLPLESNSVDLYISQFGFEYSNVEKSLEEATRVLKDGGQFGIVFHHSRSMILNRNRKILTLIEKEEVNLLINCLTKMANAMGNITSQKDVERIKKDPKCEDIRAEINHLIKLLVVFDEAAAQDSDLMRFVAEFFKAGLFWPVTKKLQFIEFITIQMETLRLRLTELINASFDESKLAIFVDKLYQNNMMLNELKVLKSEQNEVLSWYLHATKFIYQLESR